MHDTLPHAGFTKMIITLWAVWSARRKAIHESIFQSPEQIHRFVDSYIEELDALQVVKHHSPVPRSGTSNAQRWLAPQTGFSKINVDGAFSRDGATAAAAAFCRDDNGQYVGASAIVVANIADPATVEALACREWLALAADLNLSTISVVSDCQMVVADISQGTRGAYSAIIQEIKERKSSFTSCHFMYESRNFNFEAHILAKHASSLGIGRHVWLGLPYDPMTVPVNIQIVD
jgi:ribonuclease HI